MSKPKTETAPDAPAPETHEISTTPETFVSVFARIALSRVSEALKPLITAALATVDVRTGFGRGANYTKRTASDKYANASASIEPTLNGRNALILNEMADTRLADAAGRLCDWLERAVYPSERADGKSKANHHSKERKQLRAALGFAYSGGSWVYASPEWDELAQFMPSPVYRESKIPNNSREMIAFFVASEAGNETKDKVYISLKKDGSDGAYVQALIRRGFLFTPVKKTVHANYQRPVPVKVEDDGQMRGASPEAQTVAAALAA